MLIRNYAYATPLSSSQVQVNLNICITLNIVSEFKLFEMCILLEYVIVNVILGYILNTLIRLILIIVHV